ncbi:MAG: hypothetical protein Q4F84_03475, partial [Fibrobacter sp.]|nr:hypothetical protein [Fibrobacter sp.]
MNRDNRRHLRCEASIFFHSEWAIVLKERERIQLPMKKVRASCVLETKRAFFPPFLWLRKE